MNENDVKRLIEEYCDKHSIDIQKGFPEIHKHELMKYLSDHKKREDRKIRKRKKFDDTKIENIIGTVMGRIT